jgi:hypothetical protein
MVINTNSCFCDESCIGFTGLGAHSDTNWLHPRYNKKEKHLNNRTNNTLMVMKWTSHRNTNHLNEWEGNGGEGICITGNDGRHPLYLFVILSRRCTLARKRFCSIIWTRQHSNNCQMLKRVNSKYLACT